MLRFVPLTLIVVALAGCGSSSSSPATQAVPSPTPVSPVPKSGLIVFGHGAKGNSIIAGKPTNTFPQITKVAWVGKLSSIPTQPVYVLVQKYNGTKFLVKKQVAVPASGFITGKLTAAQLHQKFKLNNAYTVQYTLKSSSTPLAFGQFNLGAPTNTGSAPGY